MNNQNIKIKADSESKKMFGIGSKPLSESEAQKKAKEINDSRKGEAVVKDGELSVLRPIRD